MLNEVYTMAIDVACDARRLRQTSIHIDPLTAELLLQVVGQLERIFDTLWQDVERSTALALGSVPFE